MKPGWPKETFDMSRLKKFLKDWMLVISILTGAGLYLFYMNCPALHPAGPLLLKLCKTVQPVLLFMMLFLSFCKIEPRQMRPARWMVWNLLLQGGCFVVGALFLWWSSAHQTPLALSVQRWRVFIESFMLCMICPTATACAVVTDRLGGSMAGAVTYTVLINLMVAVLIPLFVPLIYPQEGMDFWTAFCKILAKVFPLLILPCLCAWGVRLLLPKIHAFFLRYTAWSFYLWAVALTIAILMSTRGIVQSHQGLSVLAGIALMAVLSCLLQFGLGKRIGHRYDRKSDSVDQADGVCRITAGQSLGQKNTVFGIWVGYTFMDPLVSVVGGFYSICHNVYNTWQLYRLNKR